LMVRSGVCSLVSEGRAKLSTHGNAKSIWKLWDIRGFRLRQVDGGLSFFGKYVKKRLSHFLLIRTLRNWPCDYHT
jgi:hypothetical protein